ncbi:MAG: AraC family transcriptional regulator [Phycisphaeraceae bacterium]|nr:AraC family transcriptional regulator [Phycisphaeraceae bacterium]
MTTDLRRFQADFLNRVVNLRGFLQLFDTLPEVYFFAKDTDGRFTMMNRPLMQVLNVDRPEQVLGKTDDDFFSPDLAERYRREDQEVMAAGRLVAHRVWIVPDARGVIRWYVSSKIPLMDRAGRTLGIAGAMRDYEKAGAALAPYQRFAEAMRHVAEHYDRKITAAELAKMTHLSVSQFNRQFKKLFSITPAQYIGQVRLNAACRLLAATNESLESIAAQTGFFDASHFVKQFKKSLDQTPAAYRRRHAAGW